MLMVGNYLSRGAYMFMRANVALPYVATGGVLIYLLVLVVF